MKKPDFLGVAKKTWAQLRRFPTSDALADAVLVNALYGLLWTPFGFTRYFPLKASKWNGFLLLTKLLLTPFSVLRGFNLSLRLRQNERKARRTSIILSSVNLLLVSNVLFISFLFRNGPTKATEAQLEAMTEKDRAAYQARREELEEMWKKKPWKPYVTPIQIAWSLVNLALTLNVLFRALQPSTRARFRSQP